MYIKYINKLIGCLYSHLNVSDRVTVVHNHNSVDSSLLDDDDDEHSGYGS